MPDRSTGCVIGVSPCRENSCSWNAGSAVLCISILSQNGPSSFGIIRTTTSRMPLRLAWPGTGEEASITVCGDGAAPSPHFILLADC